LTFGDDNFLSLEAAGVKEARNAIFVLVAGGLGERLGYKGIKVTWVEFLVETYCHELERPSCERITVEVFHS
jgi:hypothetical protein